MKSISAFVFSLLLFSTCSKQHVPSPLSMIHVRHIWDDQMIGFEDDSLLIQSFIVGDTIIVYTSLVPAEKPKIWTAGTMVSMYEAHYNSNGTVYTLKKCLVTSIDP